MKYTEAEWAEHIEAIVNKERPVNDAERPLVLKYAKEYAARFPEKYGPEFVANGERMQDWYLGPQRGFAEQRVTSSTSR